MEIVGENGDVRRVFVWMEEFANFTFGLNEYWWEGHAKCRGSAEFFATAKITKYRE